MGSSNHTSLTTDLVNLPVNTSTIKETMYIIDGSGFIFGSYYGVKSPMYSPEGIPVHAVYGFMRSMINLIRTKQPHYITIAFDRPGPSFRKDIYPKYKANRSAPPPDLPPQYELCIEGTRMLNILPLSEENMEADDVIGTIVTQWLTHTQGDCVIVSKDKDMTQLVNDRVTLWDGKESEMGRDQVITKMGVSPEQVIDLLGLAGDTSDNIPGIPGIGIKTAAKLLQEYSTLDDLLKNAHQIKGKRGDNLVNFADQAILSRTLARIKCDIDMSITMHDLYYTGPNMLQMTQWMEHYNFHSLIKNIQKRPLLKETRVHSISLDTHTDSTDQSSTHNSTAVDAKHSSHKNQTTIETSRIKAQVAIVNRDQYRCILSINELKDVCTSIRQAGIMSIDFETTSLQVHQADILGIALAWQAGDAVYIPLQHYYLGVPTQLEARYVWLHLQPLLEDLTIIKVGQNIKYEKKLLKLQGIKYQGWQGDAMLMAYLLDASRMTFGLDALSKDLLSHQALTFKEVAGKSGPDDRFSQVTLERATAYAAEDADLALRLYLLLKPQLQSNADLWKLYTEIELPLNDVLVDMELQGIMLDAQILKKQSLEVTEELNQLSKKIHQHAGHSFNIDSPKQLSQVLFNKLSLKKGKKTATGYSTKQEVLEALSESHPIINLLLRYRHLAKLKSTYLDALPRLISTQTHRVHSSFKQSGTVTGRLSSSNPNLQNIPMRTTEGKKIRQAFITQEGWSLISADYSQVELRLLAHFAQAQSMIEGFQKDLDIHAATAAEMYHCSIDEISVDQRRSAKAINFGLMYGMGAHRLAENLKISRKEAKGMITRYFTKYSEVQSYFQIAVEEARVQEYASTLYGRKRPLPEINQSKGIRRQHAERLAVNTPIQGTAADILKVAMVRLHEALRVQQMQARLLLTVHDELVLECPDDEVKQVCDLLKNAMEGACSLSLPLKVEMGVGRSWAEIH
jgi:DNA polymerase I